MSENKNGNNKSSSPQANNIMGIAAIIVVGIFVICVIVVLAKGLFASNSSKVPDGLYTGTLSSELSSPDVPANTSADNSSQPDVSAADSSAEPSDSSAEESSQTDESSQDDSSTAEVTGEKAYITEYAYLRTEPSQDGEQIICMSPNLEVTVLERGFDGYCKVTFMNFDTPLEGYVYEGYLSQSPIG